MTAIAISAPPAARAGARPSRLARAGRDVLYLVTGLPIGVAAFTVAVTAVALAAGLLITLAGLPILVGALYAGRAFARVEHARAGWVLGPSTTAAAPARRWDGGLWDRVKRAVADPAGWRGLLWAVLALPAGIAGFVVAVASWTAALGLLTSGAWMWALPNEGDAPLAVLNDTGVEYALLRALIGAALVPVACLLCRAVARGVAHTARAVTG